MSAALIRDEPQTLAEMLDFLAFEEQRAGRTTSATLLRLCAARAFDLEAQAQTLPDLLPPNVHVLAHHRRRRGASC